MAKFSSSQVNFWVFQTSLGFWFSPVLFSTDGADAFCRTSVIWLAAAAVFSQHELCTAAGSVSSSNKDRQSSASSRDMGKIYQVLVHGLRGEKMIIDLCNTEEQMKTMTVQQLKEKVADKLPETAGQENLRLIFTDKMLEEDSTPLSEYGIQHMSVIQLVIKVPGGLHA